MSPDKKNIIVVKLGSSTVVDPSGVVRESYLRALAQEIARIREQGWHHILVSSGAIACGYPLMGLDVKPRDIPSLQAAASVGQGVLSRVYSESFGA